jgi:hypothetical protein
MARDLHDTLLQTLQGTKMVADTALDRPGDAPALVRALKQVSASIGQASEEGRSAVNASCTPTTEGNDLAAAFRRAIEDGPRRSAISASIAVTGNAREMHPVVRDEVYRIGRNRHFTGTRRRTSMFAELVESELRWWDLVCVSTRVEIQFPTVLLQGCGVALPLPVQKRMLADGDSGAARVQIVSRRSQRRNCCSD